MKRIVSGKPRLLIILNRLVIGGPAADTISLAWFLKDDFDILVIYGQHDKNEIAHWSLLKKYESLKLKKVKFLKKRFFFFYDVLGFSNILFEMLKFRAHIVHTHGAKAGFAGRIAAWICRVPVIIHTFHGHLFHSYFSTQTSGLLASIEKRLGKITTAAIALSKTQKVELVERFKIIPEFKISVIQLGFDFDEKVEKFLCRKLFRSKYNLQANDVAIGIVSRIVPVKNHFFFLKVIETILSEFSENPPAFFIIGDGELRGKIEKELQKKHILFNSQEISEKNRIVFTSWQTNIYEVMNGLDIVTLTSLSEGTPLSLIEAEFFKKPVVSTDAGGVCDVVMDEITGFVIKQYDLSQFCNKLSLLIKSRSLRGTMGAAGRKFATVQFSKNKEVAAIKNLYTTLLTQKGYSF